MNDTKLLLSQFTNEEGFELNKYLTHLFEYVSLQLGSNPAINPPTEVEDR
ncbi:hypothetical protein V7124_03730 [Neobacillus niacini]|jgi:hypothetical protein